MVKIGSNVAKTISIQDSLHEDKYYDEEPHPKPKAKPQTHPKLRLFKRFILAQRKHHCGRFSGFRWEELEDWLEGF